MPGERNYSIIVYWRNIAYDYGCISFCYISILHLTFRIFMFFLCNIPLLLQLLGYLLLVARQVAKEEQLDLGYRIGKIFGKNTLGCNFYSYMSDLKLKTKLHHAHRSCGLKLVIKKVH